MRRICFTWTEGGVEDVEIVDRYDMWPAKPELQERHFFELEVFDERVAQQWAARDDDPADGGAPVWWTCRRTPLADARLPVCEGIA